MFQLAILINECVLACRLFKVVEGMRELFVQRNYFQSDFTPLIDSFGNHIVS